MNCNIKFGFNIRIMNF